MDEFEPVFPVKAIIFQILFLLVAIAIEAAVLRRRLRLGYGTSVKYATSINLATVVVGWFSFFLVESLVDARTRAQIISYILFDRVMVGAYWPRMDWVILTTGLIAFFATLLLKIKGLELIMRMMGTWSVPEKPKNLNRAEKYDRARTGQTLHRQATTHVTAAVLRANALSFTAILGLLLLRYYFLTIDSAAGV